MKRFALALCAVRVAVSESDLTLVYVNRTANMKEVLRRESAKHLVSE